MTFSAAKLVLPVPASPDPRAQTAGIVTIPFVIGAAGAAGWIARPSMPSTPTSVGSVMSYAKSIPIKYWCSVGIGSAAASAISCRVVQYRGGA